MPNSYTEYSANIVDSLDGQSVVFVGMMGCGKTAIGRVTAKYLELPFYDADEEIEKAAGMSVADFFDKHGEAEFRNGEQKVITRLLEGEQCIVGLGGGAYMKEETRKIIANNAVSIWLNVELETLVARVLRKPGKRPLLAKGDPAKILAQLLEIRKNTYAKADIAVVSSAHSKNKTRDSVLLALEKFLKNKPYDE